MRSERCERNFLGRTYTRKWYINHIYRSKINEEQNIIPKYKRLDSEVVVIRDNTTHKRGLRLHQRRKDLSRSTNPSIT